MDSSGLLGWVILKNQKRAPGATAHVGEPMNPGSESRDRAGGHGVSGYPDTFRRRNIRGILSY
jgi:hypothetical protein